jgi:2-iminobutanoate/2-iminopropanoate deaminase
MKMAIIGGVAALSAIPVMAGAEPIERIGPKPGEIILQGVKIPAGAETFVLSGLVALPIDPARAESAEDYGDTQVQTVNILNRIKALLEAEGYSVRDLVKLTVFVVGDPKLGGKMDFAGMNAGFQQFFGTAENPTTVARSTVQVAALTAPKYLVEIEATAAKAPSR